MKPIAVMSIAVLTTLGLLAPLQAQDATHLQKVKTSRALFDIGISNQDPLMILAAAKLRKEVPLSAIERAPDGGTATDGSPLEWQDMLASAQLLITGNPILEGMADDIIAERSKGVTDGPVYSIADIRSGGRDTYDNLPFDGGKYAEIYVEGPAGSDLNLEIRDSQARIVCTDTDISAIAYCGWKPAESGVFHVTVVSENGGGRYSLMSN